MISTYKIKRWYQTSTSQKRKGLNDCMLFHCIYLTEDSFVYKYHVNVFLKNKYCVFFFDMRRNSPEIFKSLQVFKVLMKDAAPYHPTNIYWSVIAPPGEIASKEDNLMLLANLGQTYNKNINVTQTLNPYK